MKILNTTLIVLLLATMSIFAQSGIFGASDGKHGGMGGVSTSNAVGLYSIGNNPAMFHQADTNNFIHLILPSVGVHAYTNTLSFEEFNDIFGHEDDDPYQLTDADKQTIKDAFNENGEVLINGQFTYFAFGAKLSDELGSVFLSMRESFNMNFVVPGDPISLVIDGNKTDTEYSFNDLSINQWWVRSYSLGYSRDIYKNEDGPIKNISGGVSLNLYQGLAYSDLEITNSSLYTYDDDHRISGQFNGVAHTAFSPNYAGFNFYDEDAENDSFSAMPDVAGMGIGFDIGLSAKIFKDIVIAAAVTDIGSISWNQNAQEHTITGTFELSDITNEDELDSLQEGINTESRDISEIAGDLPTAIRFGATVPVHKLLPFPGLLYASADLKLGMNDVGMNSSETPRFGIGLWWQLFEEFPAITTGISNDRLGDMHWSLGVGYESKHFDVYFSSYDIISTLSPQKYWSVALTLQWKI